MCQLPRFTHFIKDEEGATVIEYAVLIALIIAACIVIVGAIGQKIDGAFNNFGTKFENALSS
ncbi:MAG: Flp family type IVb pilin [Desulfobulbaceae bacterium]|jgi:pilus assembly protein Flp/PilA|nr:Flp family type IVb pilin [Desulfobulbaceae bacterium]